MNASQNSSTIGINLNTINIDIVVDLLSINYDVSDCLQNCSNKGECAIDAVNKKFECICFENYAGSNCETSLNPCILNNPCLNNGSCIFKLNTTKNYECGCDPNKFYGDKCEFRFDLCANYSCLNKGICTINEQTISPYCSCLEYFSGDRCETQSDELKKRKGFISFASAVAIISIIIFYLIILIQDLLNAFVCKPLKKKKKSKKK